MGKDVNDQCKSKDKNKHLILNTVRLNNNERVHLTEMVEMCDSGRGGEGSFKDEK